MSKFLRLQYPRILSSTGMPESNKRLQEISQEMALIIYENVQVIQSAFQNQKTDARTL